MKTKIKGFMAIIMTLFTISSFNLKAQCPYAIQNNLTCDVIVNITIYDISNCNIACANFYNVPITANGGVFNIPCGSCRVCDISVDVIDIGGNTASQGPANFTSGAVSLSTVSGCTSGSNAIQYISASYSFQLN